MITEEDEYYDSIDDSEFEECRSFCNDKFYEEDSETEEDGANKINELVPFYTGNVEKSEVDSLKNDSTTNSITTLRNTKLKRRKPMTSIADQRKNRSYLTMFYARTGTGKPGNAETNRAACSELSPKSDFSCEDGGKSTYYGNIDSESLYDRFMEKDSSITQNPTHGTQSTVGGGAFRSESETTLESKLLSISEAHFNSLAASRQMAKREMSRGRHNSKPLKLGELGGLGPNIVYEKLELLRKRQDYGKTVSEKNRIKIMENKVVRKLKHEIRESNKC